MGRRVENVGAGHDDLQDLDPGDTPGVPCACHWVVAVDVHVLRIDIRRGEAPGAHGLEWVSGELVYFRHHRGPKVQT